MLIIKYMCLTFIFVCSSYIGILKSRVYINRVEELNKFENALVMFKSKIEFTYRPIKEIFKEISNVIYENNDNIFLKTIESNDDLYISWIDSINKTSSCMSKEDKEIIKSFGKLLGKTDINGQINEIILEEKLIEKQIEKAEIEKNKNTKLYKSMGMIIGIGICIILI